MDYQDIKKLFDANKIDDAYSAINNFINSDKEFNSEIYLLRAQINYKMQKYAQAINDYKLILKKEPDNDKAKAGIQLSSKILEFSNFDRYADPNTHMDPWLDM